MVYTKRKSQQPANLPQEKLKGVLRRIRYTGKNYWTVATVEGIDGKQVTIVGNLLTCSMGDNLLLTGEWTENPTYGKQFKFHAFETLLPSSDEGIVGFLGSQMPNVGRSRAIEIVRHFGKENVFDVMEQEHHRLAEISGITPTRASEIHHDYMATKGKRDTLVFLKQFALTDYQAAKIMGKYGDEAREVIKQNPYKLVEDIDGFGFLTVDAIALKAGVDRNSIDRAKAGCLYLLKTAADQGHTFLPRGTLRGEASRDLGIPLERIDKAIKELEGLGHLIVEKDEGEVYMAALWQAEEDVARRLIGLMKGGSASG